MKHNHYYRSVLHLEYIDIYRILYLYEVSNPCLQHAAKKILCAGTRGSKNFEKDIREAVDSLNRALEMFDEDGCSL